MAIIDRNVANEPQPLPKRQLTEAHLLSQYAAERSQPQQPAARSPSSFQHIPRKPSATGPSLFSPATSKAYASAHGTYETGSNPSIRQSILPSQQAASLTRSPMRSPASTPLQSRCCSVASLLTSICTQHYLRERLLYQKSSNMACSQAMCSLAYPFLYDSCDSALAFTLQHLSFHCMMCYTAETLLTAINQEDRRKPACLAG